MQVPSFLVRYRILARVPLLVLLVSAGCLRVGSLSAHTVGARLICWRGGNLLRATLETMKRSYRIIKKYDRMYGCTQRLGVAGSIYGASMAAKNTEIKRAKTGPEQQYRYTSEERACAHRKSVYGVAITVGSLALIYPTVATMCGALAAGGVLGVLGLSTCAVGLYGAHAALTATRHTMGWYAHKHARDAVADAIRSDFDCWQ